MIGQELIINFEGDRAYLTDEKFLSLKQFGLPEMAKEFSSPASWKIVVLGYIPHEKRLFVEGVSYSSFKQPITTYQRTHSSFFNEVEKVNFRSIDTFGLLHTLNGRERNTLPHIKYSSPDNEAREAKATHNPQITQYASVNRTLEETFFVSFKNIRFGQGCVTFDKRISQLNRTLEFTIQNEHIREEFDAVKNYFSNVLETKKIEVVALISLTSNEIINIETKSKEIELINEDLIDRVKLEFVKGITKKKEESNQSLFTMEEFFDTLTDEKVKAGVFYDNENSLFDDLLKITNTKHYKHLRLLSSKHAHSMMRLRFGIKPFSFVFLIEGNRKYHIVWETLDTEEATYVWNEEKDVNKLKQILKKIDGIMSVIKNQGKMAYINSTDDDFKRIYHDYTENVDGFVKWKNELESLLI